MPPFAFFGRSDYFNVTDDSSKNVKRQIAGIKYNLYKGISVVLTGENAIYETTEDLTVDLNLQISF